MAAFVDVEFAGGVELLFDNKPKLRVDLKELSAKHVTGDGSTHLVTVRELLHRLREKYVRQRPELFMQGDTIRPGILVVINECDWELLGGLDYVLEPTDKIVFISTLHGG